MAKMKDELKIVPKLTQYKENINILVYGKKGYGKTSFVRGLLEGRQRVIFIDTLLYEYDDDGVICSSYVEFLKAIKENPESFRVVFRSPSIQETQRVFKFFVERLYRTTLLLEEADAYDNETLSILIEHLRRGRHRENNLVTITRHPVELNDEFRKHSDVVISFQQDDVNVLSYLAKINKKAVEELPRLEKGQYIVLTGKTFFDNFYKKNT